MATQEEKRWVRAVSGPLAGKTYRFADRIIFGRGSLTDIQIDDKDVSRQHACLLEEDNGNIVIVDMGSINGTWIGDKRIQQHILRPGERFRIQKSEFELGVGEAAYSYPGLTPRTAADEDDETRLVHDDSPDIEPIVGCGSPLHVTAQEAKWKYCPACAKRVT